MKTTFLISSILWSLVSWAEGPIEFLNRNAGQIISGQDCRSESAGATVDPHCPDAQAQKKTEGLQSISEQVYYNQLAELEIQRLQCAVQKSESLKTQQPVAQKALERVNETLPYLDSIAQEIRTLTNENQLLRGQIGSFENTNATLKMDPKKKQRIDQYNARNEILKKKMLEYERRLAEIPASEIPEVRTLIEDRLSGKFSAMKPFSAADFQKLSETATARMKSTLKSLEGSK